MLWCNLTLLVVKHHINSRLCGSYIRSETTKRAYDIRVVWQARYVLISLAPIFNLYYSGKALFTAEKTIYELNSYLVRFAKYKETEYIEDIDINEDYDDEDKE